MRVKENGVHDKQAQERERKEQEGTRRHTRSASKRKTSSIKFAQQLQKKRELKEKKGKSKMSNSLEF